MDLKVLSSEPHSPCNVGLLATFVSLHFEQPTPEIFERPDIEWSEQCVKFEDNNCVKQNKKSKTTGQNPPVRPAP